MDNSIPICRSIFKHWVYTDAEYLKVWLTMLSRARYIKEPKKGIYGKVLCTLNYAEFVFGYKAWSENTGISYQRLRGLIGKLLKDNMIILKTQTNHFTIYEIVNYAKFNSQNKRELTINGEADSMKYPKINSQQSLAPVSTEDSANSQPTVSQQSGNSQVTARVTTNEEGTKKVEKEKKAKDTLLSGNKFPDDSIELSLASEFYNLVLENNPKAKKPNFQSWAKNFDLMIRRDNRNLYDIQAVMKWSQKDSFWYKNILSPEKLREKFDQLTMKMDSPNQTNKTKVNRPKSFDAIDEWARMTEGMDE